MIDLLETTLRIHQSSDPPTAFHALAESVSERIPLRAGLYVRAADHSIRNAWPTTLEVSDDLIDAAVHVLRPEVFPLGSEFPFDAGRHPDSDMLLLPLHCAGERSGACVLIAEQGTFGEDPLPWQELATALQQCEERHRRVTEAEERCAELQRRVEETEALHTLGLAANRTLDQDEVLGLVARFTRTLLGAQYVTVNTIEEGRIRTVASVGLVNAGGGEQEYHLARTVVEGEKPLTIGGEQANLEVTNFPFHAAEGMRTGLGIPLSLFGDTFGALVIGYRQPYEATSRDIRLALTLAGHAAVAISNARLHETVAERSRELERANRELRALTEAKERFFASINHELRNPLGAISGYQALVLDGVGGDLPDAARGFIEKAQRAATTLQTLVNDILDLSKIVAGKMEVEPRECTVAEIVDGVLNTIQPLADGKGVPLTVAVTDDLPLLRTDPDRVQQILVNLLSNAVKFTAEGEIRLSVGIEDGAPQREGDPAGRWISMAVSDPGPGIAPDDLQLIFEEYEQVKGTKGGTGLGLPISRRLARLLGGDLWADSQVGVGSTFVLRLPADLSWAVTEQNRS